MIAPTPLARASAVSTAPKVARTRPLPVRKLLLFRQHQHLLTSNQLVLFLRPGDFNAHEWRDLRAQLAALPPALPADLSSSSSSSSSSSADSPSSDLKLTLLRPGLLPALLRNPPSSSSSSSSPLDSALLAHSSHLKGPLCVLTSPSLHPPTLSSVLKLLTKFSRTPPPNAPPPAADAAPLDRLSVLSSLVEHRAVDAARTQKIAELPPLEVLRAQIVGLLSAPGSRITGVLGARAREVGRTVEGFKVGLEEQANGRKKADEATA
ncbi:hypothetical protein JCM8547_000641 [Rhodosporidiobolus lusitaniae]